MNRALLKRCACPRARWAKCPHGFHFRKMVKGRRWIISLDDWLGHEEVRSVGEAEAVAADMLAAMKADTFSPLGPARTTGHGAPIPRVAGHGHTFASVAATFLKGIDDDPERKPRYRACLRSALNVITTWPIPDRQETLGALPIRSIENALLERFYKSRVALGRTTSSRTYHLHVLRAFSRWAAREGYVAAMWLAPKDPSHTVKRRKGARRHRRLALPVVDDAGRLLVAGEYERLLAVAAPRLRDLCIATYESGVRLAELNVLQWQDVDLPRHQWTIRDSKDPDGVKSRILPLSETLEAVLVRRQVGPDGKRLQPDAAVFGNEIGEPVASITTAWRNAVLTAHGFPVTRDPKTHGLTPAALKAYRAVDLVFHDLRHEAASQWLEGGLRLEEISFLLGHESYETTRIYLNARPENLAARLAAFDRARREAAAGKSGSKVDQTEKIGSARALKMVPTKGRKRLKGRALA